MHVAKMTPEINKKMCKKCELCVAFCPEKVFTAGWNEVSVENAAACKGCLACIHICPDFAIRLLRVEA